PGKPVSSVKSIGMTIPEKIAVKLVGSALQPDIDDRPALDSELHARVRLHVEFGNSIQRNQSSGCTRDGRLTQRRLAVVSIIVRNTVDCEVIGGSTSPVGVHGLETAAGAALHPRHP